MAQVNLSEYITTLRMDPTAKNDGTWFARGAIHHDGRAYAKGTKLPELNNEQVAQLLEVNALTTVDPNASAQSQPAPNQSQQDPNAGNGEQGQSGSTRLDENGNEVPSAQ